MADYRRLARQKAQKYGLDPYIFERQIGAESGFNPNARSPAGASGIAQIMPATARGWGVNPNDPVAALDAAAKNMARYVRRYGSYENALRAYNAGPGAIERSRGYSETNNYVAKILRGRDPGRLGQPVRGGPAASSATARGRLPDAPQERSGGQQLAALIQLPERQPRSSVGLAAPAFAAGPVMPAGARPVMSGGGRVRSPGAELADALTAIRGLPGVRVPDAPAEAPRGAPAAPARSRGRANVSELFWQGPGGVNVKNNRRVPQGFVGGHDRHVHVAAPTEKGVLRFAELAQEMGLSVGEHPKFGGVGGGHVKDSNHFARRAIDVTGSPEKLAAFARRVAAMARR